MLQVENLTVRFGGQAALTRVSFAVQRGEVIIISGPSGCGKSTLARCLNGLIPHNSTATLEGRVIIDGLDTRQHPVWDLAAHVGLVLQHPEAQLFNLTVEEEVAFGPRRLGLPIGKVSWRVEAALAGLGLAALRHRAPGTLSAGEKQRLAIAAAMAVGPRLLVLDEPTANLDVPATRSLCKALTRLAREEKVAIIILEHKIGDLARLASRLLILEQGRIVANGSPDVVLGQRSLLHFLGLRRPTSQVQAAWPDLITPATPLASDTPPFLQVRDLRAGYGRHTVLQGINLKITQGEMLALVGDNGTGKSTLARAIAGLLPLQGGTVRLARTGRRPRPGHEVALLLEAPDEQLFCDTVEEEVRFAPENLGLRCPDRVEAAIQATHLQHLRHQPPHTLSLGQRQRAALAALLALQPQLLILDEPTLGQDWGHLSRFMDFIRDLNAKGMTVLLISHDYKLVHQYAQRIVLLEGGRIAVDGLPRDRQPQNQGWETGKPNGSCASRANFQAPG